MGRKSLIGVIFRIGIAGVLMAAVHTASAHSPHDSIAFLAVSPDFENDQTLYIGVLNQLQVSTNGGDTWKRLHFGLTQKGFIRDLAISPNFARDGTLFLSTSSDGIYRSKDRGQSWHRLPQAPRGKIVRLRISQSYDSDWTILAVSAGGSLFVSRDAGGTWRELPGPQVDVSDALVTSIGGVSVIVAMLADGSALRLVGDGVVWATVRGLEPDGKGAVVSAAPGSGSVTIVAGSGRVYTSHDGAASFIHTGRIPTGPAGTVGRPTSIDYSVAPDRSEIIYVSTWHGGAFASRNDGKRWEAVSTGLTKSSQADKLGAPHFRTIRTAGETLFLAGFNGLFRSDNSGAGWTELETVPVYLPTSISVSRSPDGDEQLFITTADAGPYVGRRQGAEWEPLNLGIKNPHQWSIRSHSAGARPGLVLSADNKSIYRLVDDSMPWERVIQGCKAEWAASSAFRHWLDRRLVSSGLKEKCANTFPHGIVFTDDFASQGYAFFGTRYEGVFRSSDRGQSWEQVFEGHGCWVDTIAPAPQFHDNTTVFASVRGRGLFRSTDAGDSWDRIPVPGLDDWVDRYVHARLPLGVSPDYPVDGTIFLGSVDGLYASRDRGSEWSRAHDTSGLPAGIPVVTLALSPTFSDDGYMLVSLQGRGLFASADKGETFFEVARELTRRHQKLLQIAFSDSFATNRTVYAASEEEVLVSQDRGQSWSTLDRPVLYEDRTAALKFSGDWSKAIGPQFSAFSAKQSDHRGDTVTLKFEGTGIGLLAPRSPEQGMAEVFVNGESVGRIDQFAAEATTEPVLLPIATLPPGLHTIKIKVLGSRRDEAAGSRIVIDAFQVDPVPSH